MKITFADVFVLFFVGFTIVMAAIILFKPSLPCMDWEYHRLMLRDTSVPSWI